MHNSRQPRRQVSIFFDAAALNDMAAEMLVMNRFRVEPKTSFLTTYLWYVEALSRLPGITVVIPEFVKYEVCGLFRQFRPVQMQARVKPDEVTSKKALVSLFRCSPFVEEIEWTNGVGKVVVAHEHYGWFRPENSVITLKPEKGDPFGKAADSLSRTFKYANESEKDPKFIAAVEKLKQNFLGRSYGKDTLVRTMDNEGILNYSSILIYVTESVVASHAILEKAKEAGAQVICMNSSGFLSTVVGHRIFANAPDRKLAEAGHKSCDPAQLWKNAILSVNKLRQFRNQNVDLSPSFEKAWPYEFSFRQILDTLAKDKESGWMRVLSKPAIDVPSIMTMR